MGSLRLIVVLVIVGFDCCVKVAVSEKIEDREPRNFVLFRKYAPSTTQSQKSCSCSAMVSCSCCEVVKIFYTKAEKQLCFNMTYRNALNFDLSLDSMIIKTMTVTNYKPFYMCSLVPGLLFTTICVHILEINQFARSITVCPRLEVASKKERWQITYGCVNISIPGPLPPTPMNSDMNQKPPGMQGQSPMSGTMSTAPRPTQSSQMPSRPMGAQMPASPMMPGMTNSTSTMQMPPMTVTRNTSVSTGQMPGTTNMGQMPSTSGMGQMPGMPIMGQMSNASGMSQIPSMPVMGQMPSTSGMGQMPGMPVMGQVPNTSGMGQIPNTPGMGQMPGMPVMGQVPNSSGMGQMPSTSGMGQTPGMPVMGQGPNTSGMGQMPGMPVMGQMPGMPVMAQMSNTSGMAQMPGMSVMGQMPGRMPTTQTSGSPMMQTSNNAQLILNSGVSTVLQIPIGNLTGIMANAQIPGVLMLGQMPGVPMVQIPATVITGQIPVMTMAQQAPQPIGMTGPAGVQLKPTSTAMVQVTGTATVGQIPGITSMNQIPTTIVAQKNLINQPLSETGTSNKLSNLMSQILSIPGLDQLVQAAAQVSDELSEGPTSISKITDTPVEKYVSITSSIPTESNSKFIYLQQINSTDKEGPEHKSNITAIKISNLKPYEKKFNTTSENSTISHSNFMSDDILLHIIDKLNSRSNTKSNVTFINSDKLVEQLKQFITVKSNESNVLIDHTIKPNMADRLGLRVLRRQRRNNDIFDLLHQSNRCERAYRICITKSKHVVVSRLKNPRNTSNKPNTCLNKPARIIFGRPDNMCIVNNNVNGQIETTTATSKATVPVTQTNILYDLPVTHAVTSQAPLITQTDNVHNIHPQQTSISQIPYVTPAGIVHDVYVPEASPSQAPHVTQVDSSLGAIIIHDESFEGSDYHPQNNPYTNPLVAKRPDIFPLRTPPLIAQQLIEEHLLKYRHSFNDTVIIRDSSENSEK